MSEEHVNYDSTPTTGRRYAGFWMRFWAYLADLIIVFSINGILLIPFRFINDGASLDIGFWTVTGILGSIMFYLYFLFMTKAFNQTLGKMIFGLKVIREDAKPLQWSDLLFREVVGRFIHRAFFITVFLYIVVGFTAEKQGVHDIIGSTRVVFDE
ncbi:RDD family protein [Aquibacillus albus]|uniref:RDD family membrane protein YckC n=1 Tax=Aquibacillus albus TaxID=1168171 RepID=A0ABS2N1B3_9BACI|nr:RDD family protein [Aquibacillus albus]MBM7571922.1 putative RDD family membrane protein YckC [Aquibacillus albus]